MVNNEHAFALVKKNWQILSAALGAIVSVSYLYGQFSFIEQRTKPP